MTNKNTLREYPSLDKEHKKPHGWIQWKGTDVCVDIYCKCGALCHFDGDFMYHIKCKHCGRIYECDGHIKLLELDFEPEGTKIVEDTDLND